MRGVSVGYAKTRRLLAHLMQLNASKSNVAHARVWARASNEVEMLLRCHEFAARLALAQGQPEQSRHEAEAGLALATGGFALFRSRLACLVARAVLAREPRGGVDAALAALEATAGEDAWGSAEALTLAQQALEAMGSTRGRESCAPLAVAFVARCTESGSSQHTIEFYQSRGNYPFRVWW